MSAIDWTRPFECKANGSSISLLADGLHSFYTPNTESTAGQPATGSFGRYYRADGSSLGLREDGSVQVESRNRAGFDTQRVLRLEWSKYGTGWFARAEGGLF